MSDALADRLVMGQDQPPGRRVRQQLIRAGIDLGMMPGCEREACELGPAGGILIKDVECDTINHGWH